MKKLAKILGYGIAIVAVLLLGVINFTIGWRPFFGPRARPLTGRKFESTPARLARGKYLAQTRGCFGCHAPHNWKEHGAPLIEGKEGSGQFLDMGDMPGKVMAPNITSDRETGAGTWTDDQFARAIREGIGHDGRALFPMMPYESYRHMSDEDLASLVVFLRTLPPVRNPLPKTQLIFPVNYLIRNVPEPVTEPVSEPSHSDPVKWGEYLVTTAACVECHSPVVGHERPKSMYLAGGFHLKGPWGEVASANITPDASGIGYYDESLFIQAMHTGYVKARELNSIMPYGEYQFIPEDELKVMFAYLRSLKPVKHRVDNSLPPTDCKVCRGKHGGGDQN
jgi:hypothetical protein